MTGRDQSAGPAERFVRATFALIVLAPLALVVAHCGLSPAVPWIVPSESKAWIMADVPVGADLEQWGDPEPALTRFVARLEPDEIAANARLRVRTLGDARVLLGGVEIARFERFGERGRARGEVEIPPEARGAQPLVVEVRNATGPGLLALASEGLTPALSSATGFAAARTGEPLAPAIVADDTRRNPRALAVASPREAIFAKAPQLLVLALLGAVAFAAGRRAFGAQAGAVFGIAAPIVATALWLGPVAARFAQIPLDVGFDASHHVAYVDHLLANRSLPDAASGWSTYHPPLFYALAAGVLGVGGGPVALKMLGVLAGLAGVWISWAVTRRLAPNSPARAGLAALFAAVVPVNLTTSAYFSNEALHGALAGGALLAIVALLLAPRVRSGALLFAALLVGAAALTKFTALVVLPVAAFFLAWKLLWPERASTARAASSVAVFAGGAALVAGWFYLHTYLEHGTPLMGNWALPGADQRWWQQPGFHTPAYYLGFGEALLHPYLSGFHSFWDALYSTAWGDGYIAGRTDPWRRHAFWNYDFMTAGYSLALPATAALGAGFVALAGDVWRAGDPRQRLAVGFLLTASWAVTLAFVTLTAQLAFFAQAKAAYGLMLTGPFALAFATGYAGVDGWLARRAPTWARGLLAGWLVALAAVLMLGFVG